VPALIFRLPSRAQISSLLGRAGTLLLLLGLCTQVNDGDTITVKSGQKYLRVRLAGIDAPELYQEYGQEARAFLNRLCYGRQLTLQPTGTDVYGRMVARIYLADGQDVNRLMVQHGQAWYSKLKNQPEDKVMARLQTQARKARLGLWSQEHPQPPWQWRRAHPRPNTRPAPRR
jgi:endonuclease YncB( thermonuclease family)